MPAAPAREGYTFLGWYLGEEQWSFIGYSVTSPLTLTAKWEQKGTEGLTYSFDVNSDVIALLVTGISSTTDPDIVIPETHNGYPVTGIGYEAFGGCTWVTGVTIPDSVTAIGNNAFGGCTGLTEITIPDSVTTIGNGAFSGCTGLTKATLSNGISAIHEETFNGCTSLAEITIPDGVESIGRLAFCNCHSLTSIVIPGSVTAINDTAFANCIKLIEVWNESALSIVPGGISGGYLGYYALIVYTSRAEESKLHQTEDGYVFYEDGDTVYLIRYDGDETALTLPDRYNGKSYAIYRCAFYDCDRLTSVFIPEGVTDIGYSAFEDCDGLTGMVIPSGITRIQEGLFMGCDRLESVEIPESVLTIEGWVFNECVSLSSVRYNGSPDMWAAITVGDWNDPLLNARLYYYYSE